MTFEEELAAGVFTTSFCLLCATEAPATQTIRTCCEAGKQEDLARFPFPTAEKQS